MIQTCPILYMLKQQTNRLIQTNSKIAGIEGNILVNQILNP